MHLPTAFAQSSSPPAQLGRGRYAPSPSGPLHVGNLRTALAAWAWARSTGREFLLRVEDIDPDRNGAEDQQMFELESLGLDWDQPPIYQSQRGELYDQSLKYLGEQGRLFQCYCSRKDIREAASAPHGAPGLYPGTCRDLTGKAREQRRADLAASGRRPSLRFLPLSGDWPVHDEIAGDYTAAVDMFVLQRADGVPAYNLAVVVDDMLTGIDLVVRGDDLLQTAPGQAQLTKFLGGTPPSYAHVPLVLNCSGKRLAKRDGAVTLEDLTALGWTPADLVAALGESLGVPGIRSASEYLEAFDPKTIPKTPYQFDADLGFRPYLSIG